MANHASAKKAVRKIEKRTLINKNRLSRVKTLIKKFLALSSNLEEASKFFPQVQSEIERAAQKGIFHKRKASRLISRLVLKIKTNEQAA